MDGEDQDATTHPPRHAQEVMALVHSIRAWPDSRKGSDYTPKDWSRLIHVAIRMQRADRLMLRQTLADYVVHYGTAWEEGVDRVAEWSKPFLLLRVMYEIPLSEHPFAEFDDDLCEHGSFESFVHVTEGSDEIEYMPLADPIRWAKNGPRFVSRLGGYMGADYAIYKELTCFYRHFKLRDLEPYRKLFAE